MAASREGSIQLHLRPLDGTSFTPIPGTEDGRSPFWSPDSRSIAFFTAGRLQRIDVSGGPPRALCDVDGLAYGGSWSPRGDILFAIDSLRAAGTTPGIRLVRDTGGTPAQVTTLDPSRGETGHRSPQFLPDGGSFVFTALGHRTEIRSGSLQNRTTKLLVTDAMLPAFVPPGDSALPAPGERAGRVVRSPEAGGQRDRARHRKPGRWRLLGRRPTRSPSHRRARCCESFNGCRATDGARPRPVNPAPTAPSPCRRAAGAWPSNGVRSQAPPVARTSGCSSSRRACCRA